MLLSAEHLSINFGSRQLLEDVNFYLNEGDKVGVIGINGTGKSTFLKVLAGKLEADAGTISRNPNVQVSLLEQNPPMEDDATVLEQVFLHFPKEFRELNEYEAKSMLNKLGLPDYEQKVGTLSGGQRKRVALAAALIHPADVLVLDEPTNHLDAEMTAWLEDWLRRFKGGLVMVTHDRYFLERVVNHITELSRGKLYHYEANYSKYLELRKERREQQQKAYDEQQKFIAETKEFIERFKGTYSKTLQVQSRVKMLEKLEILEVDEEDTSALRLKFPPSPRSGNYPVIMENVGKTYGDHVVFKNATLTVERGDKLAFVGKNGEGKSTLVKCIMGEIADFTGKLQLGHNVKIGYFAQNQAQLLNENLTVFDTIDYVAQGDIRLKIRDILGAFMFGGEASDKKVKVLSGGERTRLAMIRLLLEPVNLLILDEPTNHLDMRSKDVLKDALREFDGTVIVVSHDREFLDGLVDKVYEFGNQKVVEHLGGIYNFLEHKKMDSLRELERSTGTSTSMSGTGEAQVSHNKLSYEARKELSKVIKKAEKAVAEAEARISELENGIAVIEAKLATPEGASDASLYGEYSALKKELSDAMDLWTERTMELEELNTQDS